MKKRLGEKILINSIIIPFCFLLAYFSYILLMLTTNLYYGLVYCFGVVSICEKVKTDYITGEQWGLLPFGVIIIPLILFALYIVIYVKFLYPKIK